MRKEDTIAFNADYIRNRVKILGLKRLWLAETIGVSEKTITRWLTGKVSRMSFENALALAECLQSRVEDFETAKNLSEELFSFNKEVLADKVISENLLLLLSPTGNWELIESIIRSCIDSGLSLPRVGRLLNLLSITSWRKQLYSDAEKYALKAREIGEKINDKAIIARSFYNTGTVDSLTGNNDGALQAYLKCYEMRDCFDFRTDFASVCTNLSMVYRDMADFSESLRLQKEAIKIFEEARSFFNLAIAWQCMSFIYAEIGQREKAIESIVIATEYAQKSHHAAGLMIFPIYHLNALMTCGNTAAPSENAHADIERFLACSFYDPFCFEFIGRFFRLTGNLQEAESVLTRGLKEAKDNPIAKAAILHEQARLALARHNSELEKELRLAGNLIYKATGSPRRIFAAEIKEYGSFYAL